MGLDQNLRSLSRQARWQHARVAEGNCRQCGKPAAQYLVHCLNCAIRLRERNRKRTRAVARHNSITYRLSAA